MTSFLHLKCSCITNMDNENLQVFNQLWAYSARSYKRHFELKTQNHGEIFAMMHHVVMGDDLAVKKGKPSPDIFLAAANRFEVSLALPQKLNSILSISFVVKKLFCSSVVIPWMASHFAH